MNEDEDLATDWCNDCGAEFIGGHRCEFAWMLDEHDEDE